MWAYGTPEIWPEEYYSKTVDGKTHYYPEKRSFSERLFNSNSLPFFILLCVLILLYILDLFLENYIMKKFFSTKSSINLNQINFSNKENQAKMKEFSEISYDPMLNPEYAKILTSMLDVAAINVEVNRMGKNDESFIARAQTSHIAQRNYDRKYGKDKRPKKGKDGNKVKDAEEEKKNEDKKQNLSKDEELALKKQREMQEKLEQEKQRKIKDKKEKEEIEINKRKKREDDKKKMAEKEKQREKEDQAKIPKKRKHMMGNKKGPFTDKRKSMERSKRK